MRQTHERTRSAKGSVCEKWSSEKYFTSTKNREFPSRQYIGVFALEFSKIVQGMPPNLRGEVKMCGNKVKQKRKKIELRKRARFE